ncbi:MAG TPA: hypothetical protein VN884_01375 [Candidatus Sulfotelmatobacter sp.]|jgi:hypothetical protein|nr:hypothetical protein [Candidatus Sulfotelmatobacter sp.]
MVDKVKRSSGALILLAWLIVGVPLGWGVYNTVLSSIKLFQAVPPPAIFRRSSK